VDKEKGLLVAAKDAALAAKKEAADAAAAAHAAELALRGQAGLETLKVGGGKEQRRVGGLLVVPNLLELVRDMRCLYLRLPKPLITAPRASPPAAVSPGPGRRLWLDPGRHCGAGQA
jgi:hypothetical protein